MMRPKSAIGVLCCVALAILVVYAPSVAAADYPAPVEGDYLIENFEFQTGEGASQTQPPLPDPWRAGEGGFRKGA